MPGWAALQIGLAGALLIAGAAMAEPAASVLDDIYGADKGGVPFPFDDLVADLKARAGPGHVRAALIPIGRSLQRFSADPDYFASPRIVIAVDGDAADGRPLKDRVFLGYQPASGIIEAIAFNKEAGRFEFRTVENYGSGAPDLFQPADRAICVVCHQSEAPIFSAALWGETNGNPAVAARLVALGETFHGIPVSQGIDGPDAFDQAVARANTLVAAQALWRTGCPGLECRAALLKAVIRFRLGGDRSTMPLPDDLATEMALRLQNAWPQGITRPDFQIPSRDPTVLLASGASPSDSVQATREFDPETPRAQRVLWPMADTPQAIANGAVRTLAAMLGDQDIAALDAALPHPDAQTTIAQAACTTRKLDFDNTRSELRFTCTGAKGLSLTGHVVLRDDAVAGGRIDQLRSAGQTPVHRLLIAPDGSAVTEQGLTLALRQNSGRNGARMADGARIDPVELAVGPQDETATLRLAITNDIARLDRAVNRLAAEQADALVHPVFRPGAIVTAVLNDLASGQP